MAYLEEEKAAQFCRSHQFQENLPVRIQPQPERNRRNGFDTADAAVCPAKQQYPDALLFFRLGDFYELFYEDARTAARELQITLTSRDKERAIPMCGVPHHAADQYITRLLRRVTGSPSASSWKIRS